MVREDAKHTMPPRHPWPPVRTGRDFLADWRAYGSEIVSTFAINPNHKVLGAAITNWLQKKFPLSATAALFAISRSCFTDRLLQILLLYFCLRQQCARRESNPQPSA